MISDASDQHMMRARVGRPGRSHRTDPWLEAGWSLTDSGYVRPPIETPTFLDERGEAIPFGTRWGAGGPPDDAYSAVHHPERFAPLLTVAKAMIAYLERTYDVTVADILDPAQEGGCEDLAPPSPDRPLRRRAVRITPNWSEAAPLSVRFTDFPSVELRAGVFFASAFPECGCDACDEEWSGGADSFERTALAVVKGTFSESFRGRRVETRLSYPGGDFHSICRLTDLPYSAADITRARQLLDSLPAGWQPWPQRPR